MRKVDPTGVFKDFHRQLSDLYELFEEVVAQFHVQHLMVRTAELAILAAVVHWDEFVSKLFVALVNRDSSRFRRRLRDRVRGHVAKRFGNTMADKVFVVLPQHPSKTLTAELLDEKGFLPTYDAKGLQEQAAECLPATVAKRFNLSTDWEAAIEAWRALRNFVAHRSPLALVEMNKALSAASLEAVLRRAGPNQVRSAGAFLIATPREATRRD